MASARLTIALLAAFMSSCASTYTAPPRENNSVLKFSTPGLKTFYFHLNGENCTDTVRVTGEDSPFENKSGSLIVPSNKLVALTMLWGGFKPATKEYWSCSIIVSFMLEPNKDYKLIGSQGGESCKVTIVDSAQSDGSSQAKISLKQMRHVKTAASVAFGQAASTCEPAPTQQAL